MLAFSQGMSWPLCQMFLVVWMGMVRFLALGQIIRCRSVISGGLRAFGCNFVGVKESN
jgi:hypothetical protein